MRKVAIASILSAGLLAGCGGGGLSEQDRADYIAGCESSGSTTAQCQCTLDYFEENGVEEATDITPELTIEAATTCANA